MNVCYFEGLCETDLSLKAQRSLYLCHLLLMSRTVRSVCRMVCCVACDSGNVLR